MQWEATFIHKYKMDGYIHNPLDLEKLDKQDKVNSADSAFILLII